MSSLCSASRILLSSLAFRVERQVLGSGWRPLLETAVKRRWLPRKHRFCGRCWAVLPGGRSSSSVKSIVCVDVFAGAHMVVPHAPALRRTTLAHFAGARTAREHRTTSVHFSLNRGWLNAVGKMALSRDPILPGQVCRTAISVLCRIIPMLNVFYLFRSSLRLQCSLIINGCRNMNVPV